MTRGAIPPVNGLRPGDKRYLDECKTLYYNMTVKDLQIDTLIIQEDRPAHISKHQVTIDEVFEVIAGDYVYIQAKLGRWQLIGKTKKRRFLAIIVGERSANNTFGLVTARPANKKERSFYREWRQIEGS